MLSEFRAAVMTRLGSLWPRFRTLPVWVQALTWTVAWIVWPVPLAAYAASRPAATRRKWWAFTAAASVAWAALVALSPAEEPDRVDAAVVAQGSKDLSEGAKTSAPSASTTAGTPQAHNATTTTIAAAMSSTGPAKLTATTKPAAPAGPAPTTATTRKLSPPPGPAPPTTGPDLLAGLRVAAEGPRTGYARDLFPHWIDADGNRCDTREEVLKAESLTLAQWDPYGCKVVAGDWFSAYDGISTDQPGELDIDHVVALAEAWDSGASGWDLHRRRDFANDLGYAGSLIAVTASSNRSKSDHDPAGWMPPRQEAWCSFATDWVSVKIRWDLSADAAEVNTLRTGLDTCSGAPAPGVAPPMPPAATTTTTTAPPAPVAGGGSSLTVSTLDCFGERVTVTNTGPGAVDLTGWKVHDLGVKHTFAFPAGYQLAPGASVTVVSGGGAAGAGEIYWTGSSVWNNDGDTAHLVDAAATVRSARSC